MEYSICLQFSISVTYLSNALSDCQGLLKDFDMQNIPIQGFFHSSSREVEKNSITAKDNFISSQSKVRRSQGRTLCTLNPSNWENKTYSKHILFADQKTGKNRE